MQNSPSITTTTTPIVKREHIIIPEVALISPVAHYVEGRKLVHYVKNLSTETDLDYLNKQSSGADLGNFPKNELPKEVSPKSIENLEMPKNIFQKIVEHLEKRKNSQ